MDSAIKARNYIIKSIYKSVIKKICFMFDAEKVHNSFIYFGKLLGSSGVSKFLVKTLFNYQNKMLEQNILDINFRNPVGLSAGFDKNAELLNIIGEVGFGFAEVGSVTFKSSKGNSGKRLIRLPDKKSIWVNLGLNNKGAEAIAFNLKNKKFQMPFGVSIAKTNCKETADAKTGIQDYTSSLKEFKDIGDYYTLNVSCPNAFGGQPFHNPQLYESLLKEVSKLKIKKPIFVKLSPDIKKSDLDKIIALSYKFKISGFICSNLTKENSKKSGGFSGKIVEEKANALLSCIYKKTKGDFILIGVGGIFSAQDAYKKIKLGASLVQLITGMIYEGPNLISEINLGLAKLIKAEGYTNISQAIGRGIKNG